MEPTNITRQQFKDEEKMKKSSASQRIKIRLIPIWLRLLIVAVLMVFMIIFGAFIGYSVIGGGKGTDIFKKSTWTHIIDIVYEGT